MLLMMVVLACSSDDDVKPSICGTWSIVGYGNDQEFHTGENIVNTTRLTFLPDGTFYGKIWPNKVSGKYECSEKAFSFTEIEGTMLGAADPDLQFIGFYIDFVNSYEIWSDSELRLYYGENDYLKFSR